GSGLAAAVPVAPAPARATRHRPVARDPSPPVGPRLAPQEALPTRGSRPRGTSLALQARVVASRPPSILARAARDRHRLPARLRIPDWVDHEKRLAPFGADPGLKRGGGTRVPRPASIP